MSKIDPSPRSGSRLDYIDLCRALAVTMVIAVHCALCFPTAMSELAGVASLGRFGVQLFFTASAFTIAGSLERNTFKTFMVRRYFRIAPLYYAAIPLYFSIALVAAKLGRNPPFIPSGVEGYTPINVTFNLALMHGIYMPANNTIVPGGWSIGAEWLFYLAAPFIVSKNVRVAPIAVIAVVSALGVNLLSHFSQNSWLALRPDSFAYYTIFNNLTPFALGTIYYKYQENLRKIPTSIWAAATVFIGLCISNRLNDETTLRLNATVLPVLAGCASLSLMVALSRVERIPNWISRIGQISYSSYILHFAVILSILFSFRFVSPTPLDFVIAFPLVLVVTFTLSNFTYNWIERPFIELASRWLKAHAAK